MSENIRALIVDDDPGDIKILLKTIEKLDLKLNIVGMVNSGEQCLDFLENDIPELIFLDVEMPGMRGYEVAEAILNFENPPCIVFITGREDYALKAFELSAIDYITKPYEPERIKKAIEKVSSFVGNNSKSVDNARSALKEIEKKENIQIRKIAVKDYEERTIRLIDPETIYFVERINRRVVFFTEGKQYPTYYSLDALEKKLAPEGFIRISQQSIINLNYLEHMIPNGDGSYDVILKNFKDKSLKVSRSRAKELLDITTSGL